MGKDMAMVLRAALSREEMSRRCGRVKDHDNTGVARIGCPKCHIGKEREGMPVSVYYCKENGCMILECYECGDVLVVVRIASKEVNIKESAN